METLTNNKKPYCLSMSVVSAALKSAFFCTLKMFHFLLQPSLTMEKDGMSQERPSRPSRHPKKKQRSSAEPELSESDEYVDFAEPRHEAMSEFNAVIVGDETETSSAVQSIQQVRVHISPRRFCFVATITCPISFPPNTTISG